jgi:hypothetical protein
MFTNAVGYLMMRLTLAGGLQGVYIDGVNDKIASSPSLRRRASLRSSEVGLYFIEFGSEYNKRHDFYGRISK